MSAAEAVRRAFLEALRHEEVWTEEGSRWTARRALSIDLESGTAVVRRTWHGGEHLTRIELPLGTLMAAMPALLDRGREWFATGSYLTDAVAALLIALDEAVDAEALDGADDLVLDTDGLFRSR